MLFHLNNSISLFEIIGVFPINLYNLPVKEVTLFKDGKHHSLNLNNECYRQENIEELKGLSLHCGGVGLVPLVATQRHPALIKYLGRVRDSIDLSAYYCYQNHRYYFNYAEK